jgi:hypothetical protein
MNDLIRQNKGCCTSDDCCSSSELHTGPQPLIADTLSDEVCCGSAPEPKSSPYERPGYKLLHFVEEFIDTPIGPVPKIKTLLERTDILGSLTARLNINRNRYKIAPGLYCVGNPGQDSAVLVTANYKLSFDMLRRELTSLDAWILVLDTRGINVWCAAGKALFGTRELVRCVNLSMLKKVVRHNQLILPQLAATGVSAHRVKKESGFTVIWGPVRAADIQRFIAQGGNVDKSMRQVTFSMGERIVLIPVELSHLPKPTMWLLPAIFLLSGIGINFFSLRDAFYRGLMVLTAYTAGILGGAVAAPVLLPWIPLRAFALKGVLTGFAAGLAVAAIFYNSTIWAEALALLLITMVISSYLAMNFTGSTPFTSPSGVEKEMRKAIPLQAAVALIALIMWLGGAFAG